MRPVFAPRPSRADLLSNPLHVTVRDFPETLQAFRRAGIDLTDSGPASLESLVGPEAPIVEELLKAVAWRPERREEESTRGQ